MDKYRRVPKEKSTEEKPDNEIRVTAVGSVSAYVSFAAKVFNEMEKDELTVKATGGALAKAVTLTEVIKRRFKGLHQLTVLSTQELIDEYEPLEEGLEKVIDKRNVAYLEIKLSKKELDTKAVGYQAPIDESLVTEYDAEEMNRSRGRGRGRGKGVGKGKGEGKDSSKGKGKSKGKSDKGKSKGKSDKGKGKSGGKGKYESKGYDDRGKGKGKSSKGKSSYSSWDDGYSRGSSKGKSSYSSWDDGYSGGKGKSGKGKGGGYDSWGGRDNSWNDGGGGYSSGGYGRSKGGDWGGGYSSGGYGKSKGGKSKGYW